MLKALAVLKKDESGCCQYFRVLGMRSTDSWETEPQWTWKESARRFPAEEARQLIKTEPTLAGVAVEVLTDTFWAWAAEFFAGLRFWRTRCPRCGSSRMWKTFFSHSEDTPFGPEGYIDNCHRCGYEENHVSR